MSEECDYRTQREEAGLWQVWLKMEELARVHAGKLSAVVTCAIVAWCNLCINHTQGGTQTQMRGIKYS